jgi:hypothetical protein
MLTMLRNTPNIFDAEEDERMATAVISMVTAKKITVTVMLQWLHEVNLNEPSREFVHSQAYRLYYIKRVNIKHFVRCLYFRLKNARLLDQGADDALMHLEHTFNPYF